MQSSGVRLRYGKSCHSYGQCGISHCVTMKDRGIRGYPCIDELNDTTRITAETRYLLYS